MSEAPSGNDAPNPAPADNTPFLRRKPVRVFGALLLVAAIAGTAYWLHSRNLEETDDAFIDTDVTSVAARVAGQVIEVKVDDNRLVKAGDVLAIIDPNDFGAEAARAKAVYEEAKNNAALIRVDAAAKLESARAQLAEANAAKVAAEAGLRSSRADLLAAKANQVQRDRDEKRYLDAGDRSVSQAQVDSAKALAAQGRAITVSFENRTANFEAQLISAEAKVKVAEANLAAAETVAQQIAVADAKAAQSKAARESADLSLSYTKIIAPVSGRVTKRSVRVGQYVRPGQAVLAIVPRSFWVTANFKETQIGRMRPGQPVAISVDAYPDLKLKGHIDSIQSGSGASFSLLPPENATGNYVKVVQRVPVKILFDNLDDATRDLLGVGLSVIPEVNVSETPAAK